MTDQAVVVSYPHPSDPAQPGATVSFPDEATAQQHAGTAWKALQLEDANAVNQMLDEHIKVTNRVLVRTLKHLHTATGPGGIAAAPVDAKDGFSREDFRKLATSIEKNGLGAVHQPAQPAQSAQSVQGLCPTCGRDENGLGKEDHDRLAACRKE